MNIESVTNIYKDLTSIHFVCCLKNCTFTLVRFWQIFILSSTLIAIKKAVEKTHLEQVMNIFKDLTPNLATIKA